MKTYAFNKIKPFIAIPYAPWEWTGHMELPNLFKDENNLEIIEVQCASCLKQQK